jgi:hypothetical protein
MIGSESWRPVEKSAVVIDFRTVTNLGTKVLADKVTIDEILSGCSNPKVEKMETEVYGYGLRSAIAVLSPNLGQIQSLPNYFRRAPYGTVGISPAKPL